MIPGKAAPTGKSPTGAPVGSTGVVGTAGKVIWASGGTPVWAEANSNALGEEGGTVWDSERVIVPLKPGNAGGGKGPHFRSAFEEAQVR